MVINPNSGHYYCIPCHRNFSTESGAIQHAANASVHVDEWCGSCEWLFVGPNALDSHLSNSRLHNSGADDYESSSV